MPNLPDTQTELPDEADARAACVLSFNASDPSGAGGLAADIITIASVGAHALPVVSGAYIRDTAQIVDFHPMDDEAVAEQARAVLEDVSAQVIKVGFLGSPEAVSAISSVAADYADVPVIAYMPDLSWWHEVQIDLYLDAFRDLMLPQTTVLVGNHNTLARWLLPDWQGSRSPGARELARAAHACGVPYTLVTGIGTPDHGIENVLATPQSLLHSVRFDRIEGGFSGAGDTLSAALAALLATGQELAGAVDEALSYLDRSLEAGFQPGMGLRLPDRMFWAQPDADGGGDEEPEQAQSPEQDHDTRH